jgi:hypothetical protein
LQASRRGINDQPAPRAAHGPPGGPHARAAPLAAGAGRLPAGWTAWASDRLTEQSSFHLLCSLLNASFLLLCVVLKCISLCSAPHEKHLFCCAAGRPGAQAAGAAAFAARAARPPRGDERRAYRQRVAVTREGGLTLRPKVDVFRAWSPKGAESPRAISLQPRSPRCFHARGLSASRVNPLRCSGQRKKSGSEFPAPLPGQPAARIGDEIPPPDLHHALWYERRLVLAVRCPCADGAEPGPGGCVQ